MRSILDSACWVWLAIFVGAALWVSGCASRNRAIHSVEDIVQPEPAALFGSHALQYEANLERWYKRQRVRVQVLMLAKFPDQMRIDIMTPLGASAVLTLNADSLALRDRENHVLQTGAVCKTTIESLIGIALEPAELLRLLVAMPSVLTGKMQQKEVRRGRLRVERKDESGFKQTLLYHEAVSKCSGEPELRLEEAELTSPKGKRLWKVQYVDYETTKADSSCASLPRQIRYVGKGKREIRIDIRRARLRSEVDSATFTQKPEPGERSQVLHCADPNGA